MATDERKSGDEGAAATPCELGCAALLSPDELRTKTPLQTERVTFDPRHDRAYCGSRCSAKNTSHVHTHWPGPLGASHPKYPYYCPFGFSRYGLKVDMDLLPDWRLGSPHWQVAYHGTAPHNVHKIIENGFKANECQHGFPAAYLSPSIEYCSHPRYARVVVKDGYYYQFILQVRVDVRRITCKTLKETLSVSDKARVDPHVPNDELEWLVPTKDGERGFIKPEDGLVVTGLLVRRTTVDPLHLAFNDWWKHWNPEGVEVDEFLQDRYYITSW